jgi:hypothetical protein
VGVPAGSGTIDPFVNVTVAGAYPSLSIANEKRGTVLAGGTGNPSFEHPFKNKGTTIRIQIRLTSFIFILQ